MYDIMVALSVFGMLKWLMQVMDSALLELHRPHAQSGPSKCIQAILGLLIFHDLTGRSFRRSEALSPDESTYRSENELLRRSYVGFISLRSASISVVFLSLLSIIRVLVDEFPRASTDSFDLKVFNSGSQSHHACSVPKSILLTAPIKSSYRRSSSSRIALLAGARCATCPTYSAISRPR